MRHLNNKNTGIPDKLILRRRFSWEGCQEKDVIAPVVEVWAPPATPVTPGNTARSKKDGSTSSFPTIVGWISYNPIQELSRWSVPNRLFLRKSNKIKSNYNTHNIHISDLNETKQPTLWGTMILWRQVYFVTKTKLAFQNFVYPTHKFGCQQKKQDGDQLEGLQLTHTLPS